MEIFIWVFGILFGLIFICLTFFEAIEIYQRYSDRRYQRETCNEQVISKIPEKYKEFFKIQIKIPTEYSDEENGLVDMDPVIVLKHKGLRKKTYKVVDVRKDIPGFIAELESEIRDYKISQLGNLK